MMEDECEEDQEYGMFDDSRWSDSDFSEAMGTNKPG
jgi:hypothetical protein